MAYRKRTLRSMSPVARKLARLLGELDSVMRRGKGIVAEIATLECDSRALNNHTCQGLEEVFKEDPSDIQTQIDKSRLVAGV